MYDKTKVKAFSSIRLKYLCDITTGNKDTKNATFNGIYPFYVRSPIIEKCDTYSFDGEGILVAGDGAGAGYFIMQMGNMQSIKECIDYIILNVNLDF